MSSQTVAEEVRGVEQVENHLLTALIGKYSDEQAERDVLAMLTRDACLRSSEVGVTVTNGVVTLSGSVGSAFLKQRATEEVKEIGHVKAVDNRMTIDPLMLNGDNGDDVWPSEEQLAAASRMERLHDSRMDAEEIQVSVEYGHVVSEGRWAIGRAGHI